jgi:hypothetical protein
MKFAIFAQIWMKGGEDCRNGGNCGIGIRQIHRFFQHIHWSGTVLLPVSGNSSVVGIVEGIPSVNISACIARPCSIIYFKWKGIT